MASVKWPEELKDVIGSSPKKGCGSFTMMGPEGGRVEVNKRGHFYVTSTHTTEACMVTWKKHGGLKPGIWTSRVFPERRGGGGRSKI
jgi:hypothetical protein